MMQQYMTVKVALCLVGCLHLATFAALLTQNCHLFGRGGLQPVAAFLQLTAEQVLPAGSSYTQNVWTLFFSHPTLLWLHPVLGISAAALLNLICTAGLLLSLAAACGVLHPLMFGSLWALQLSVVNIGQAFLPQPGDAVLLEMTFACMWLAQCLPSIKQAPSAGQAQQGQPLRPQQQLGIKAQIAAAQPATLCMQWLLFKLLLLSCTSKATVLCSNVNDLAGCYHATVAHGQPTVFTWWLQNMPNAIAAIVAAASLLEGVAAFAVLCPSATVQQMLAKVLLCTQLIKACIGTMNLADAAAAVLCITLMHDSIVVACLQRIRELYAGNQAVPAAASGSVGPAAAELLGYKSGSNHKRSLSADSLASLISEADLEFPIGLQLSQQQGSLLSRRTLLGIAALCAVFMFSVNNRGQLVLRWTPAQIVAALHILVPCAAAVWLVVLSYSALQSCKRAVQEAAAIADKTAAEAASKASVARGRAQAGSSTAATAGQPGMPHANGIAADLTSPPMSPTGAAAAGLQLPAQPALPPIATKAATAVESDTETAKPARRGRATSAKAAADSGSQQGTPRKGSRSKQAAASEDGNDAAEAQAEDSTATGTPKATRGRRAAAGRGKKAAAAAIAEEAEAGEGAADAAAFFTPEPAPPAAITPAAAAPTTPAVPSASAAAAKPAAAAVTPAVAVVQPLAAVLPAASGSDLGSWLKPKLHVGRAVLAAAAVIAVFVAGLPAVLVPAGYSQASLGSVPGLLSSYQFARNYGLVSSAANMQLALGATAVAARPLPGSHLVFEFSTSADGNEWQPVLFKHGLTEAGPGLGHIRGLYEPILQGRLLAAGTGDLADNMWLLSLADKLLEGDAALTAVLAQPVSVHEWVKADLVRYSPSSLTTSGQDDGDSSNWILQQVAAVLPPMPRGDQDLKDTLKELHWESDEIGRACSGTLVGIPPAVLVTLLLLAVAARHALATGGILHSLAA